MKRIEFKQMLQERIVNRGEQVNEIAIESALSKTVRHMRNTIGGTEWSEEQLDNAVCFYDEFGKEKTTFNQAMYRGRNSGHSRY